MTPQPVPSTLTRYSHAWLKQIRLASVSGPETPLLQQFTARLLERFRDYGHSVLPVPAGHVDVLLTTAAFGVPLNWREAVLFTARRRFGLEAAPTVFTLLHARPQELEQALAHFERALARPTPDPQDYDFPGLAPRAYHTLHEQGRRGGPLMALVRLVQAQVLSARAILVVGEDRPQSAYTFDLVGAHPRSDAAAGDAFYDDLMLRILTAVSTHEITEHELRGEPVPADVWANLATPPAMLAASRELGRRRFFTEMVRVSNLVSVPLLETAVSDQYSEGCFATWEPGLDALVATVTGSARPVEKDKLSQDELAVIVGVRPDGRGAQVRHVEGLHNSPPSSEAVEMMDMDAQLPHIELGAEWGRPARVPVARSKLHGHRGVRAFDPRVVEHVPLAPPYYHYPVSCATAAQAAAIRSAFARAGALLDPSDPRQIVFTVLPGHGVVIVEKWVPGKAPFQAIWEAMDAGQLEIENHVPQGPLTFIAVDGRMHLHEG